ARAIVAGEGRASRRPRRADHGGGFRARNRSRRSRSHFRCFLYDQASWNGPGSFHLSIDRRISRRPALGHRTEAQRIPFPCSIAEQRFGEPMKPPDKPDQSTVFVIDDDASVRDSLQRLFHIVGLRAETFASAADFADSALPDVPSCLVLDVRLPGI